MTYSFRGGSRNLGKSGSDPWIAYTPPCRAQTPNNDVIVNGYRLGKLVFHDNFSHDQAIDLSKWNLFDGESSSRWAACSPANAMLGPAGLIIATTPKPYCDPRTGQMLTPNTSLGWSASELSNTDDLSFAPSCRAEGDLPATYFRLCCSFLPNTFITSFPLVCL